MSTVGLKQFRQEGCVSYLVFDVSSGEAFLVDPRADLADDYRDYIAERKLKLQVVVDTRLHWHHLSGSHLLGEVFGVPIAMAAGTVSKRVTRGLVEGDVLRAGQLVFTVLETPGVSPDAICLFGLGLLFSGDTVLVGSPTRTDLSGGDPMALWDSLQHKLAPIPGSTIVLPGYDNQDLLFSTLDVEKKRGGDWAPRSREAFAYAKAEERYPRGDGDVKRRLQFNLSAHPEATPESHFGTGMPPSSALGGARGVAAISVEKYSQKMKEASPGTHFVDVREPAEFAAGHMPRAENIPLSELALRLGELSECKRIYLSCQSGRRSYLAARTLDYLGLPDVVNVSGGFRAWENAGLTVV